MTKEEYKTAICNNCVNKKCKCDIIKRTVAPLNEEIVTVFCCKNYIPNKQIMIAKEFRIKLKEK